MPGVRSHKLLLAALAGCCVLLANIHRDALPETRASLEFHLIRHPNDGAARGRLAAILAKSGHPDDAIVAYRAALADGATGPAPRWGLARALADKGGTANILEAQRLLEDNLKLHPTDPATNESLAGLLAKSARFDDAITAYRTALASNPTNPDIRNGLARALIEKGGGGGGMNTLEARRLLEDTLKLHPSDPATNETLGELALRDPLQTADPAAAARIQKYFETALAADPQRTRSALKLSDIYLEQSRINDAALAIIPALSAHPRDPALHLQKAKILTLLGLYDLAADAFNTGTALDPDNANAYFTWGLTLLAAGKPETAERILRHAMDLDPKNAIYHMHYARALWKEGLANDALAEFAKALDKDNKSIPIYLELSSVFQSVGKEAAALRALHMGMEADPNDLTVKVAIAQLLLHAKDPLVREPWEAATLLQTCVERTNRTDISVLVAAADAWAQVELYDKSLPLMDDALALARIRGIAPDQIEALRSIRQRYQIALDPMPEVANLTPYLSLQDVTPGYYAIELRAPDIKSLQPTMDKLISKPLHMEKVPDANSALDPDLYTKNLKPFLAPGYRP